MSSHIITVSNNPVIERGNLSSHTLSIFLPIKTVLGLIFSAKTRTQRFFSITLNETLKKRWKEEKDLDPKYYSLFQNDLHNL